MKASAESRILEIAIRGNINFISKAVEADIVAAPMMLLLCWCCAGASIRQLLYMRCALLPNSRVLCCSAFGAVVFFSLCCCRVRTSICALYDTSL